MLRLTTEEFRDLCDAVVVSIGEGQAGLQIALALERHDQNGDLPDGARAMARIVVREIPENMKR